MSIDQAQYAQKGDRNRIVFAFSSSQNRGADRPITLSFRSTSLRKGQVLNLDVSVPSRAKPTSHDRQSP